MGSEQRLTQTPSCSQAALSPGGSDFSPVADNVFFSRVIPPGVILALMNVPV